MESSNSSMLSGVNRPGFATPGHSHAGHMFTHDKYSHLDEVEWQTVVRMQDHVGTLMVANLLQQDHPTQRSVIHAFMEKMAEKDRVILEFQHRATSSEAIARDALRGQSQSQSIRSIKIETSQYRGEERESLSRWLVEMDVAMNARQLREPSLQVALAMSSLGGRAKAWAFGRLMSDSDSFPTYEIFVSQLKQAFQPPNCEFRTRSKFLSISQGKRDLHEYVQEARYLISSITESPVDQATQVSVFLNGLRNGPVRTQLFREYPDTLEEAILKSLQEDFSMRQARVDGYSAPRQSRPYGKSYGGPSPMDISSMDAHYSSENARDVPRAVTCYRCGKQGHFANNCRSPANNSRSSTSDQRVRGKSSVNRARPKNVRFQ